MALQILIHTDEMAEARTERDALKLALATRPDFDPKRMFPEYFPQEQKQTDDNSGIDPEDYKNVEWKSPGSDADAKAEWERLSAMLNTPAGFLTGDEVTEQFSSGPVEWSEWF